MAEGSGGTTKKPGAFPILLGVLLGLAVIGAGIAYHYLSTDYLVSAISNDSQQKRRWAVDMLILKGQAAGKPVMAIAMDGSSDHETRRLAIFILGEIHYRDGAPQLTGFFRGDDLVLREQAAYALGRLGDPAFAAELISGYENAPKGLKMKILSALGELGGTEGIRLLKSEAENNGDGTIRDTARFALGKIQPPSGTSPR
jgi:HEAT repeat protein